jgi:hypothetical protein
VDCSNPKDHLHAHHVHHEGEAKCGGNNVASLLLKTSPGGVVVSGPRWGAGCGTWVSGHPFLFSRQCEECEVFGGTHGFGSGICRDSDAILADPCDAACFRLECARILDSHGLADLEWKGFSTKTTHQDFMVHQKEFCKSFPTNRIPKCHIFLSHKDDAEGAIYNHESELGQQAGTTLLMEAAQLHEFVCLDANDTRRLEELEQKLKEVKEKTTQCLAENQGNQN